MWLKSGDNNSKFFHRFANQQRISNTIWEILLDECDVCIEQSDIQKAVVDHFRTQFDKSRGLNILDQFATLRKFPRY